MQVLSRYIHQHYLNNTLLKIKSNNPPSLVYCIDCKMILYKISGKLISSCSYLLLCIHEYVFPIKWAETKLDVFFFLNSHLTWAQSWQSCSPQTWWNSPPLGPTWHPSRQPPSGRHSWQPPSWAGCRPLLSLVPGLTVPFLHTTEGSEGQIRWC